MSRGEDGGQTAGVFHVDGAWREEDRSMEDGAASHSHARARLPQAWLTNLLTQPIIISVLHTPPRTLQPQGLCTCRAPCLECSFSAPPPPSVSVRLAPWLCHPTPSPSECSPARFPRGRDCHSERSGPRFVLHYHLPPPREGEDLASPVHRWVPRAGGQPGLHMARFPPQVCPPHGSRDLGGLLGPKPRKGKRLYSGRAGPMLHFLCEVTVSPAPGTAITSLDCSRVPLPTVQKAPSC